MSAVGIVCALPREARAFRTSARNRGVVLPVHDGSVLVACSGMGGEAARRAAEALVDAGARALVSWGMAGGLDPTLAAGAVILPREVIGADGNAVPTTESWRSRVASVIAAHRPLSGGTLLTLTHAVGSPDEKASIFRETGAIAVDMESLAVAGVAAERGLPFLAVRAIVDTSADALPECVQAAVAATARRLPRRLTANPTEIAGLVRLAFRYRSATRALDAVARTGALRPTLFEPALATQT